MSPKNIIRHLQNFNTRIIYFSSGRKNLKILLQQTGFELLEIRRYSILPQLKVLQFLHWVLKSIQSKKTERGPKEASHGGTVSPNLQPSPPASKQNQGVALPGVVKMLAHAFLHFLRYTIGSVLPKAGRPQTLVLIARKV